MPINTAWQNRIDSMFKPYGKQKWHDAVMNCARNKLASRENVTLLEAGCGWECWISRTLRVEGFSMHIIGIDIDEKCLNNKDVDEAMVGSLTAIPLDSNSVDLVFCGNVIEHLEDPRQAFREIHRVLKPGGAFIAWTPNLYNPAMIVSAITPHSFHVAYRRMVWGDEGAYNAPTFYRANTPRGIRKLAATTGFVLERMSLFSGAYSYFRISKVTYITACILNLFARIWPVSRARLVIMAVMTKPASL